MTSEQAYNLSLSNYPDVLTTADVCSILKFEEHFVRKLFKSKQLPAIKIGNKYIIAKAALIDFLIQKEEKPWN